VRPLSTIDFRIIAISMSMNVAIEPVQLRISNLVVIHSYPLRSDQD
jgi:hypothetical protein